MSETIFKSPTGISEDGRAFYGDDSRLHVRFFVGKERHGLMSAEQGRDIFVPVDMVEIRQPGERDVFHGRVTGEHIARFPRQWEAFQGGREHIPDGTPLSILFPNNPEKVENLRFFKVFTVEQLAALPDNAIQRIGLGARNDVNAAKKFIDDTAGYAGATKMNKRIADAESENATLREQMARLEARLAEMDADDAPRRGPGRPRKEPPVIEEGVAP